MQQLTKKQRNVLQFIYTFYQNNHFCPTYKEIAAHFNYSSVATVRTYLEHLEEKGYLSRNNKARAITLHHNPYDTPIIGQIQAGLPIEAIENIESNLYDLPLLQQHPNRFGLHVKGNSMINKGIFEGDIAIIDTQKQILSGQVVAAKVNNDVTLKTYKKINQSHELHPENADYEIILLNKHDHIIGTCIGVIRSLT